MNKAGLLELVLDGETPKVVFRRDDLRPVQLAREVVAFANGRGGRILLGVNQDGAISGIQRDQLQGWVFGQVLDSFVHPAIIPYYEEVQLDDAKRVAVITLGDEPSKPYAVRREGRDEVYVRAGHASKIASREQLALMYRKSHIPLTEQWPVAGSGLRDLSRDRLEQYLGGIVGMSSLPSGQREWHECLCLLGFMRETEYSKPQCTIAGLVLFGYSPRRLLRNAGIRWMAFDGVHKSYRALDDRVVDGPLLPLRDSSPEAGNAIIDDGLIEKLLAAMRPFIFEESAELVDSVRRSWQWHYPVEVLKESVVNALAHRDWSRNEEIEIARYADRLCVLSPGALDDPMTVDMMIAGRRQARNQLIVAVLRDYGYIEPRGMGVSRKIIPLMREHNRNEPEFEATEDYLRIKMYRRARPAVR